MSSNVKTMLEGLNKKELIEIAELRKISIPHNWSKSLIVELLALNVSVDDVPKIKMEPLVHRVKSDSAPIIVLKDLVKKFEDVVAVGGLKRAR